MTPDAPVLRFAPTPNGRLHLGHAYSALLNERMAHRLGGRLLLRIEDTDPTRSRPEFEQAIADDLAWLGIVFESPVRRQSDHLDDYARALARLQALVYPCFCTRSQIAAASGGARDPDGAPLHRGRCVAVSAEETQRRLTSGEPAALRLDHALARALAPETLDWSEFGEGDSEVRIPARAVLWGDVALRGKERPATYHLAVVVDDAIQGVTDVVRGRDLYASTAIHRLLQALLGLPAPRYRHHRLALDAEGAKMAKSAASTPLAAIRAQGVSAADVRASLGFGPATGAEFAVPLS
jgi:glutamyl-Q tRNA(Asp) synthetase